MGWMWMDTLLLHFEDDTEEARRLARAAEVEWATVERLELLGDELHLRLPENLPRTVALYRRFGHARENLLELLLLERHVTRRGTRHLSLITPCLDDIGPGAGSGGDLLPPRQVLGQFLAGLFDLIITPGCHHDWVASLHAAFVDGGMAKVTMSSGLPGRMSPERGELALSRLALALESLHRH